MENNIYVYIFIMAAVTYAIRVIPLAFIRKEIKNNFIRSFLYYVPYVSLSVMTFPAILSATSDVRSGLAGFAAALFLSWVDGNLFRVSIGACVAVYVTELFL